MSAAHVLPPNVGVGRFEYERAIRDSDLPAPARLIAMMLTTWADADTGTIPEQFSPSLTDLAKATGLSRRAVAEHLNTLETGGWVIRTRPDVGDQIAKHAVTRYQLTNAPSAPPGAPPALAIVDTLPIQPTQVVRDVHRASAPCAHRDKQLHKQEPKTTSRATRLPDGWVPTVADVDWQRREKIPDVLARRELPKFRDYWAGVPGQRGVKLDWSATWRNWLRKARERQPQTNGHTTSSLTMAELMMLDSRR